MNIKFKGKVKKDLINQIKREEFARSILEVTGLSLEEILQNFTLEVPDEYIPGLGWMITWTRSDVELNSEHIYLVEKILKLAWLYSNYSGSERLCSFVAYELDMFKLGMMVEKERLQKSKAGKSKKHWESLRAWIRKKLNLKRKWTHVELWYALPLENEGEEFYVKDRGINGIKDGLICCSLEKRSSIRFRGFTDNIRVVKKEKTSGNRRFP